MKNEQNQWKRALRELRDTHQMQFVDIATLLDVSDKSVRRWYHGLDDPTAVKPLPVLRRQIVALAAQTQSAREAQLAERRAG